MLTAFLVVALLGSLIALVFALNTLVSLFRDKVPYVSTPRWAIEWLCANLPLLPEEGVSRSDRGGGSTVVYDLGCGDARILIAIKRRYPGITAIGIERNWWPFVLAKMRTRGTGVIVRRANFYTADLRDANIVFCFLIHSVMPKVERLLKEQLKSGTTVYSYGFTFPHWQPVRQIQNPRRLQGSKINIYSP